MFESIRAFHSPSLRSGICGGALRSRLPNGTVCGKRINSALHALKAVQAAAAVIKEKAAE
jgi:hypothetical protein